jgi:hypothetical protein
MSRSSDETETSYGRVLIPLHPSRREITTARGTQQEDLDLMSTLTSDEKRVAAAFGMRPEELARARAQIVRIVEPQNTHGLTPKQLARARARIVEPQNTHGLTPEQLAVAAFAGMSPRAFARRLSASDGGTSAIASAADREDKPGLIRAHQEVDRAHKATYDADWHASAENTSERELLDAALSALKGYDPSKDDDDNYDRLLDGAVYVMRLLNRVAPPYAEDQKK